MAKKNIGQFSILVRDAPPVCYIIVYCVRTKCGDWVALVPPIRQYGLLAPFRLHVTHTRAHTHTRWRCMLSSAAVYAISPCSGKRMQWTTISTTYIFNATQYPSERISHGCLWWSAASVRAIRSRRVFRAHTPNYWLLPFNV